MTTGLPLVSVSANYTLSLPVEECRQAICKLYNESGESAHSSTVYIQRRTIEEYKRKENNKKVKNNKKSMKGTMDEYHSGQRTIEQWRTIYGEQ